MNLDAFIDGKIKQICFYLRAFWQGDLPYSELQLFFWDTLEEWAHLTGDNLQPCLSRERVFWHVLHQCHFWPEKKLMSDPFLLEELTICLDFLDGTGTCPLDCVGIRP